MNLPDAPIAHEGFFAAHLFTVRDQEKSRDFYRPDSWREIDQARKSLLHRAGEYMDHSQLRAGSTPDQPEVILETPSDLKRVNSLLNLRVADIRACDKEWGDKGAYFLTEPLPNPDG